MDNHLDFYDIWMLSRTFNFNGEILTEAVEKTFENRKTSLNLNTVIFDSSFMKSIQLLAGRTGQEFNQRKNRKGAFWEDRYHATAVVGKQGTKQGTFVQGIHNYPIRSSTSGFLPDATKRVTQELVTPKYRATSAPE